MSLDLPIEYIKGYKKFLNCNIDLSYRVFIPRIETEFWVKKALKDLKAAKKKLQVLDIFSGSGCIGISVLRNIKNSKVDFVDIDQRAIKQIKINLKINQISEDRCHVQRSDLFQKLKNKKYDFIFANPPYVATEKIKEVQPSVLKYEPKRAILAGKKGLFYIKKFLKEAKKHLGKKGIIFMEFDPGQKDDIGIILKKEGYNNFQFLKDQFRKYRFAKISKNL